MPWALARRPVRKLARDGEHSGVVANALTKFNPSAASRSTFGVFENGWPVQPRSSKRMSSTRMKTMFGRASAAADAHGQATDRVANSREMSARGRRVGRVMDAIVARG